jgi:DNA-binding winged helix-turn-helix (wHTH) protein
MPALHAGECCSLVGVSGIGKSNVARFLQQSDMQKAYWNDDNIWIISIDSQGLVFDEQQKVEYIVTKRMISGLIEEAESRNISSTFLTWATDSYHRLLTNQSFSLAMDTLHDTCKRLCKHYSLQLIFMFDQFDNLWQTLEYRFFLNLRNMRDRFKYSVAYLLMTRNRLERMRQDTQAVESFWELFSVHTYGLGPYDDGDAHIMLERLATRAGISVSKIPRDIVTMSGGHSAILRAIFWAFHNSSQKSLNIDSLLKIPSVVQECEKVWYDLDPAEQQIVQRFAQQLPLMHPDPGALRDLQLKGIVSGAPPKVFSPLFATYVLQKTQGNTSGIVLDPRLREVRLDGHVLQEPLRPLEFALLAYLARHVGTVCKRNDVLDALYPTEPSHGSTDQRLDALLSRLRKALGESAQNSRFLKTHRGGIQLLHATILDTGSM